MAFAAISIKVRHQYSLEALKTYNSVIIGEARWIIEAMRYFDVRFYILGTNDGWLNVRINPTPTIVPSRNSEETIRGDNDRQPWAMVPFVLDDWVKSPSYLPSVARSNNNSESPEMLELERRVMSDPYVLSKVDMFKWVKEIGPHKNYVDFCA